MKYIFLISLVFIAIAIARNKNGEYLKQISFTVMVFAILNCIILQNLGSNADKAIYFAWEISYDKVHFLYILSIITTLVSLILYLFSDAER